MDAETLNAVTWSIPNALCLIGSRHGDEWNGMTQSWVTQVSMEPVLIAISVDRKAVTNRLIRDGRAFSVNLWNREDTRVFRKFSTPAEMDGQTLNGRPVRTGLTGVPIFDEAVAWLECRVTQVDRRRHPRSVPRRGRRCRLQRRGQGCCGREDGRHTDEVRWRSKRRTLNGASHGDPIRRASCARDRRQSRDWRSYRGGIPRLRCSGCCRDVAPCREPRRSCFTPRWWRPASADRSTCRRRGGRSASGR